MRMPDGALARLEVDALTRELSLRVPVTDPGAGAMSLPEAIALIGSQVPGRLQAAALDGSTATDPHYHVDVRLENGLLAQLRIDPFTRAIAWRGLARPRP